MLLKWTLAPRQATAATSTCIILALAACAAIGGNFTGPMPSGEPTPAPSGEGWIDLFDAEHAGGWKNVTDDRADIFTIENGLFHIPGASGTRYIAYTGQEFADFELHIEFKLASGTNSGVFFRSSAEDPVYAGMEIQVYDDHGTYPTVHSSGALYDVATAMLNLSRPAGEWNSYDITCRDSQLSVVMNGWKVLDLDLAKFTMPVGKFPTPLAELPQSGHIILQDHGGEVTYRNLLIRELGG